MTSAKIDVAAVVRSARRRLADPSRQTAVVLTKSDGDLYVSLSLEDFVRMIGDWWTIVHRPTTYDLPPPPSVLDGIEDPDGEDRGPPEMRTVALPEAAPARRRQRPDASADV